MVTKRMREIRTGETIVFSTGEYSDYYIQGTFRALRDIDPEAELEAWLQEHPEQRKDNNFDSCRFLAWIISGGLVEPTDYVEWHLDDYGKASAMRLIEDELP